MELNASAPLQWSVNQTFCVAPFGRGSTPTTNSLGKKRRPPSFSSTELIPYRYGKFMPAATKMSFHLSALKSSTLGPHGQYVSTPTESDTSSKPEVRELAELGSNDRHFVNVESDDHRRSGFAGCERRGRLRRNGRRGRRFRNLGGWSRLIFLGTSDESKLCQQAEHEGVERRAHDYLLLVARELGGLRSVSQELICRQSDPHQLLRACSIYRYDGQSPSATVRGQKATNQ